MKKFFLLILGLMILTCSILPQNYENAGMDYSKALFENKTPTARISALKSYIQTYTDTSNKFVKLAYYQLSLNYFETKNYSKAISIGEKAFTLGHFGTGESARLNLILANSYGIKSFPGFNKEKALKFTMKAIRLGKEANDKDVVSTANKLKKSLTGPPPKKLTPVQKMNRFYTDEDYRGAINFYSSLADSLKSGEEIVKIYGYSLFKSKKYDSALKQFQKLYSKFQKGTYAKYIADIYAKKAKRNKSIYEKSATYYLEASVLYKKEGISGNQKIAAGKAKVMLEKRYDYKSKYNAYQKKLKDQKSSSQQHTTEIRKFKKKIRNFKRYMRKTYRDVEAPHYEYDKLKKLENKLANLESGNGSSSSSNNNGGKELLKLRKKIDSEYDKLLKSARSKFENL